VWMMTTDGFFSIVQKPWDKRHGTLTVRARVKRDLERLRTRAQALGYRGLGKIKHDALADYRYRVAVPRSLVQFLIFDQVRSVNYDNFKAEIDKVDRRRHDAYARVWSVLKTDLEMVSHAPMRNKRRRSAASRLLVY